MIQIWQVPSECGPSNLVVLGPFECWKGRLSLKSIFKSWFLEKIWLYRNKIDVFVVFTLQYFWQMQFGRRNQKIIFPKDFGIQRSRWCCYHFVIENIVCLMTPRLLEVSANSIGFCQEIAELSGIPLFQPSEFQIFCHVTYFMHTFITVCSALNISQEFLMD